MTTKMAPNKVIACQADLTERLRTNKTFQSFITHIIYRQIAKDGSFTERMKRETSTRALHEIGVAVKAAYAYHVSDEMTRLVIAAANALEDDDLFDHGLAPTGCGIVRFDGGLPIVDAGGQLLRANWLVWGPGQTRVVSVKDGIGQQESATIFWTFNDALDDPDATTRSVFAESGRRHTIAVHGRWAFHGMSYATPNEPLGPAEWDIDERDPWYAAELRAEGRTPGSPTNLVRYLHAFWLLLGQKITVTSTRPPGHPAIMAAAKKAKIARSVTVVELRRREYVSDLQPSPTGRTYDHRWIVRGFWRWQPYGPGRTERRRIWIDGYVKGPDGTPLIVRDQVYALRR